LAVVYFVGINANKGGATLQTTISGSQRRAARPSSRLAFNTDPLVATIFSIPAVAIVVAALNGASLPIIGDGLGPLVGLWVLVSLMCARGIVAMKGRFGARALLIGGPLGIVATALILSGVFGWSLLLAPIASAMGPSVSLYRAAIVGVGAIMVVKWAIAWTSYLPRSR
jgi:hypothetical protein